MFQKLKAKCKRRVVMKMDNLQYMNSLSYCGTYEDMTKVIQYITSKILITPDKLQGMLWYAYGWGLVFFNMEIAPFEFVQTPYGPAETNVNKLYKAWDTAIIPYCPPPKLDRRVKLILDATIKTYGSLSNDELNERYANHCYDIEAGEEITARDIYLFFTMFAK